MNHGGEASEQIVRIMLEGTEVALKLTGSATKNVAAALYAIYKDNKKTGRGRASLTAILKEGRETRVFRMETKDLRKFKKFARKYGIRYAAIKEKDSKDKLCDVIIKAEDIPRVNHVLGKMDYINISPTTAAEKEKTDSKKDDQQRSNSDMQNNKSKQREKADSSDAPKDINKDADKLEEYKKYLEQNNLIPEYSEKNQERIFEQSPNASVVMSRTKWRELGRYPKIGAEGVLITMPEYKDGERTGQFVDVKVYDISDTYGRKIGKGGVYTKDSKKKVKPSVLKELNEHKKAIQEGIFNNSSIKINSPIKPKAHDK
ncbi:MAG: PcfB family protein [Eubacteriales bacterium]